MASNDLELMSVTELWDLHEQVRTPTMKAALF